MPMEVIRYIRSTGGNTVGGDGTTPEATGATRAFATVASAITWASSTYPDLVAADAVIRFRLVGRVVQTGAPTWGTIVTDDTRCMIFEPHTTPHGGVYTAAADGIDYNTSTLVSTAPTYLVKYFDVVLNYYGTGVSSGAVLPASLPYDMQFFRCIHRRNPAIVTEDANGWCYQATSTGGTIQRMVSVGCLFLGPWRGVLNVDYASNAATRHVVYNGTAVDVFGGIATSVNTFSNRVFVKNLRIERRSGSSRACFVIGVNGIVSDTNLSDDATSPQTALRNLAGTYVDAAGTDYTPTGADPGIGAGTNLSADAQFPFNYDLRGATFTAWPIGALAPAAGALPTPFRPNRFAPQRFPTGL